MTLSKDSDAWQLVGEGVTASRTFPLKPGATVVGRDDAADITFTDHRLSRRHAELRVNQDEVSVEDLGSSNGTLVNGLPIFGRHVLAEGDLVEIGSQSLKLRRGGSASVAAAREKPRSTPAAPPAVVTTRNGPSLPPPRSTRWLVASGGLAVVASLVWAFVHFGQTPVPNSLAPAAASNQETAVITDSPRTLPPEVVPGETSTEAPPRVSLPPEQTIGSQFETHLRAGEFRAAADLLASHGQPPVMVERLKVELDQVARRDLAEAKALSTAKTRAEGAALLRTRLERLPKGSAARTLLTEELLGWPVDAPAVAAASGAPGTTSPTTPRAGPSEGSRPTEPDLPATPEAESLLREAETALAAGNLSEAETHYGSMTRLPLSKKLKRDAERGQRLLAAYRTTIAALAGAPAPTSGFGKLPAGDSGLLPIIAIKVDGVHVMQGSSAEVLPWRILPAPAWKVLVQRIPLDAPAELAAARVLTALGAADDAENLLKRVFKSDPAQKDHIDRALADARGMPEVPTGGFTLRDDAWLSPSELARAELSAKIEGLCKGLQAATAEERNSAFRGLLALGDPARSKLHRGLIEARAEILSHARASKPFAAGAKVAEKRDALDALRKEILDLVFDEVRYPYPCRPPGATPEAVERFTETQREIDTRVRELVSLWKDTIKADLPAPLRDQAQRVLEIHAWIEESSVGEVPAVEPWFLHLPAGGELTVKNIAISAADRQRIDEAVQVLAANTTSFGQASPTERDQALVTNEYRLMMGRHALRLHEKLGLAAHGHSVDMDKLGFFSHTSRVPGKEGMGDRMRLVGAKVAGLSENIAIARSARGAHDGWTHSSGHHRNILDASWRIVGIGHSGDRWTQNFSDRDIPANEGSDDK